MIWQLTGLNAAGEAVAVTDLSAVAVNSGATLLICPLNEAISTMEAAQVKATLDAAGIRALVFNVPVQVWSIEPTEDKSS